MAWPLYLWDQQTAFRVVMRAADRSYIHVESIRNHSVANDTQRSQFEQLVTNLTQYLSDLNRARNVAGIAAYANSILSDATGLDAATEFLTMGTAMLSLRNFIQGRLDAFPTLQQFTPGQTAGFRTEADVFLATIDKEAP